MTIRRATKSDAAAVIGVLSRAFDDDPPLNWILRKDAKRASAFQRFFTLGFHRMTLPFGHVEMTDDASGAALWTPPGKWDLGILAQLVMLPDFVHALGLRRLFDVVPRIDALQKRHPREPHYYLFTLGVDPSKQGRGVGSALMKSMLARCDAERMPAYLESSTERSRDIYARHGFVVREEHRLAPSAPPMWLMWREPQPPRD